MVAIGHSAGGHLAAWAAARRGSRGAPGAVPRHGPAAVSQAGVLDLRLAWELRLSDGVVGELLGGAPERVPERYALASPAERLPLGVPALLTHGGARRHRAAGDQRSATPRPRGGGRRLSSSCELPARTTSGTSTRPTRCGGRWSQWLA